MFKTIKSILTTVTVSAILCINLLNINVQAVKSDSINLPITSNNTYEKKKVKIINGEIDLYPDIILNKKDQERFDNCKKEINLKRANRFKNKPTPCLKMSDTENNINEITTEDYNIIWAGVSENKELFDKNIDPNIELPLSDFIDLQSMDVITSSSTISKTSSVTVSLSSSSLSILNSTQSSDKKVGLIEKILNFGTISVSAAINDGFRLPYENGVKAQLTQTAFNNDLWSGKYASHRSYAAFDLVGEGQNYKITASKAGKVVYSADNSTGFGKHIVIEHSDGSYALYGHLNARNVALNANISRGQYIGNEGSSGTSAQHLHFETYNRYPCPTLGTKVENCWVADSNAYTGWKGGTYYMASVMAPTFDECAGNSNCTSGYPNVAYAWYTSQNSLSTQPVSIQAWMFQRIGTDQCLNSFNSANNAKLDTYKCNQSDGDQLWVNSGGAFKKKGSSFCMNSYNPTNAKGVVVWTCDNSADQNWNWNGTNKSFIRAGTNQCMDVQNPAPGKQVYTYQCDVNYNNANQKWEAIWLP